MLTWGPTRLASRYLIRVALHDGRRLLFAVPGHQRTLTHPAVVGGDRTSITVTGVRRDDTPGRAAVLTFSPKKSHSRRRGSRAHRQG